MASIGNVNVKVGMDTSDVSTGASAVQKEFKRMADSVGMTEKQFKGLNAESKRVLRDIQTDAEKFQAKAGRLGQMKTAGLIDTSQYSRAMDKLRGEFSKGGGFSTLGKDIGTAAASATGLNPALVGLLGPAAAVTAAIAAVGTAAFGMGRAVMTSIDQISQLHDAAAAMGVTTEALSELRHAAALSDMDVSKLDTSLAKMMDTVGKASAGGKEQGKVFKQLGLDPKDLSAMAPDKAFATITTRIQSIGNAYERVAAARAIFGKGGADVLKIDSSALSEASRDAQRLGISISQIDADKIDDAGDAFARFQSSLRGVANDIAIGLAPSIKEASDGITELVINAREGYRYLNMISMANTGEGLGQSALRAVGLGGAADFIGGADGKGESERAKRLEEMYKKQQEAKIAVIEHDQALKKFDDALQSANLDLENWNKSAADKKAAEMAKALMEVGFGAEQAAEKVAPLRQALEGFAKLQGMQKAADAIGGVNEQIEATARDAARLDLDSPMRPLLDGKAFSAIEKMRKELLKSGVDAKAAAQFTEAYAKALREADISQGVLGAKKGIADIGKDTRQIGMTASQKAIDDLRDKFKELQIAGTDTARALEESLRRALSGKDLQQGLQDAANVLRDMNKEARQVGMSSWAKSADDMREKFARMNLDSTKTADAIAAIESGAQKLAGAKLAESLQTPVEKFNRQAADIQKLYDVGAIDKKTAERAIDAEASKLQGGGSGVAAAEAGSLEDYKQRAAAQREANSPQAKMAELAKSQLDALNEIRDKITDVLGAESSFSG